jgi:hypothetical protein
LRSVSTVLFAVAAACAAQGASAQDTTALDATAPAPEAGVCVDPSPEAGVCQRASQLVESALRLQSLASEAGALSQRPSGIAGRLASQSSGGFGAMLSKNTAQAIQNNVAEPEDRATREAREARERQQRLLRLCPGAAAPDGLETCIAAGRQNLTAMRVAVQLAERDLRALSAVDPAQLDAPTRARLRTTVGWVSESLRRAVSIEQNVEFLEAELAHKDKRMMSLFSQSAPASRGADVQRPFAMAALDAANAFLSKIAEVAVGRANAAPPVASGEKKN